MPQRIDGPWQIDHGHPLADGLRDAVILFGDAGFNVVPGAPQPSFVGSVPKGYLDGGEGAYATSGTNYVRVDSTGYRLGTGDFTVSVLWRPVSYAGAYAPIFEKSNAGSREFSLFLDNGSGNFNYAALNEGGSNWFPAAVGMVAGATYRFTVARLGRTVTAYINGIAVSPTGDNPNLVAAGAGGAWYLGSNPSGGGSSLNAVYGDLFVWPTRALSADEVLRHAIEPYTVLRRPRRMAAWVSASLPDVSAASELTLAAITGTTEATAALAAGATATLSPLTGTATAAAALAASALATLAGSGAMAATASIAGESAATLGTVAGSAVAAVALAADTTLSLAGITATTAGTLALAGASTATLALSGTTIATAALSAASALTLSITGITLAQNPYVPFAVPLSRTVTLPMRLWAATLASRGAPIVLPARRRTTTLPPERS